MGPIPPRGPSSPCSPCSPRGPVFPLAPNGPVGPVTPVGPVYPVAPVSPVYPVAPVNAAPVGPVKTFIHSPVIMRIVIACCSFLEAQVSQSRRVMPDSLMETTAMLHIVTTMEEAKFAVRFLMSTRTRSPERVLRAEVGSPGVRRRSNTLTNV